MKKNSHYQYLHLAQFIGAILVVAVHSGTLTNNPQLHFFLKNILGRIAVPFFIVNNAFFFRSKPTERKTDWFIRICKTYLLWSVIYLPLGFQYLQQNFNLKPLLYLPALFVGLLYTGIYYHLWYFPALLLAVVLVTKLVKKFGYFKSFIFLSFLYSLGAVETYSAFFTNSDIQNILDFLFSIILTTRNGLFFSSIFVLIGFLIADYQDKFAENRTKLLSGVIILPVIILIESLAIYHHQGMDKNFFFYLLPLMLVGFPLMITPSRKKWFPSLRKYGQFIFFVHLIPIEIFNLIIANSSNTPLLGWIRLALGIIVPIICLMLFEKVKPLDLLKS
ncbi:hypothetical protein M2139_000223 [Enterococcus sp. PF1-24]|uniref:acyltransferase family protein n=1 Tax=unclassified Enterococcus TaxID=2608891 RepID=UPI00247635CE|nr:MULTISPECIES: acyltransferase [unclassified Enterococcus]MDH6363357.1 hypothetical protein [Enterococcus sp. PFB1-1]MDH6400342.1 hypothetical protein [Enterococcus sp. PF1-24]